jgi:hypothetical protein
MTQNHRSQGGARWWQRAFALIVVASLTMIAPVAAQTAPPNLPPGAPTFSNCGWNTAENSTAVVATSPAGSAVAVAIGEPSWQQDCFTNTAAEGSTASTSFPAYEVFPVTVHGPPNTAVTFQADKAVPTAAQVAEGIHNATLWAFFDPWTVETDSAGLAGANFTLAGAVMPFVLNDVANVTLPILASAPTGVATVGLPIEFEGGVSTILQAPGPISFGSGIGGQAGSPSNPAFNVVYSPFAASASPPLQVSMQVLGSYQNGSVGPMPQDVQVSFPQQSFVMQPDSILYYQVDETNSLNYSSSASANTYTFAVQETVGNSTYVVPLTVSVSLEEIVQGGFGAPAGTTTQSATYVKASKPTEAVTPVVVPTTTNVGAGVSGTNEAVLGVMVLVAVLAVLGAAAFYLRSRALAGPAEQQG